MYRARRSLCSHTLLLVECQSRVVDLAAVVAESRWSPPIRLAFLVVARSLLALLHSPDKLLTATMLSRTTRLIQRTHSHAHRALSSTRSLSSPLAALRPPVSSSHAFPVLPSLVDPSSEEFVERAEQMREKERELRAMWGKVLMGGGEKAQGKAKKAGKLLVRERSALSVYLREPARG